MRIKVLSGWSHYGGSTEAHLNFVSYFNSIGIEATFYGPHKYHLSKPYTDSLENYIPDSEDILVVHFLNMKLRIPCKKLILSLHEKDLFKISTRNIDFVDSIHYLNEEQRLWHNVDHPYFIAPNFHKPLKKTLRKVSKVGGVIGSIDSNKQTHKSIERALESGMDKILVFGNITDEGYFKEFVSPLISKYPKKIELKGYEENKQRIYDSVSDVFQSSKSENASFVADECLMTGTIFHGNENIVVPKEILSNEEVGKIWLQNIN